MNAPEGEMLAPEQQPRKGFNWLMACGVGCLIILIGGLIVAFALWQYLARNIDQTREEWRAMIQAQHEDAVTTDAIPAEHQELFADVTAQTQRPEAGIWGLGTYLAVVPPAWEDSEITEEELAQVQDLRGFLAADPAPNPMEVGQYFERHPGLQERFRELQQQMQGGQAAPFANTTQPMDPHEDAEQEDAHHGDVPALEEEMEMESPVSPEVEEPAAEPAV